MLEFPGCREQPSGPRPRGNWSPPSLAPREVWISSSSYDTALVRTSPGHVVAIADHQAPCVPVPLGVERRCSVGIAWHLTWHPGGYAPASPTGFKHCSRATPDLHRPAAASGRSPASAPNGMFDCFRASMVCGLRSRPGVGTYMGNTYNRQDPQQREGRLNRRVSLFGIVAGIGAALLGALATAHSQPVIQIFGGTPAPARTIRVTVSASPHPGPTPKVGTQLPKGLAFTEGKVIIGSEGLDLDQNPPEAADLEGTSLDVAPGTIGSEPSVVFNYPTAEWMKPSVPSQAQCHRLESDQGKSGGASFDLTLYRSTGEAARFCSLTHVGRDAYVVIPGKSVVKYGPLPAIVFVWSNQLPSSPGF